MNAVDFMSLLRGIEATRIKLAHEQARVRRGSGSRLLVELLTGDLDALLCDWAFAQWQRGSGLLMG